MKNELKKVLVADSFIMLTVLIFGITISSGNIRDLTAFLGAGLLLVAIVNIIAGIVLLLFGLATRNINTRRYGTSMLLVAGVSLLSGFTFCSMTHVTF